MGIYLPYFICFLHILLYNRGKEVNTMDDKQFREAALELAREAFAEKYGSGHTVAPWVMEEVILSTMPKQWNMGT